MRAPRLAALAVGATVLMAVGGCGDEQTTKVVTVREPAKRSAPEVAPHDRSQPTATAFRACDANIQARRGTTTCPFAQNTFWTYWKSGKRSTFRSWSPVLGASLSVSCKAPAATVSCTTRDGGEVRFPVAAVASYSSDQADAYAAHHDLGPDPDADLAQQPDPIRTPDADAPETASPADYGNSSTDLDDEDPGETETPDSPGENIPNYDEGDGSRVQCEDGMYSQSGGIQGACSGHGGVR